MNTKLARLLAVFLIGAQGATAQVLEHYEEQGQLIRGKRSVAAYGPDLFGDKVSLYTGGLEFVQTDVSLPGNSALHVALGRRYLTGAQRFSTGHFGDWDIDIPHIRGVFSASMGWIVEGSQPNNRCSQYGPPPDGRSQVGNYLFMPDEFWSGNFLYAPGAGEQEILWRASGNTLQPTDGYTYGLVTSAGWQLRCTTTLATGNGQLGEGFIARAPDGTTYRFDWLVSRTYPGIRGTTDGALRGAASAANVASPPDGEGRAVGDGAGTTMVAAANFLPRNEYFIYPTQITDRFGNTVTLTYDTGNRWQLKTIASSDGRTLTLTYVSGSGLVQSVTDGTRTWTYGYTGPTAMAQLTQVTQPDGKTWAFSGDTLQENVSYWAPPNSCTNLGTLASGPRTRTMTHPSGATGSFTTTGVHHGRSFVTPCPYYPQPGPVVFYATRSIQTKTITGPGLPSLSWSYDYGTPSGGVTPCTGCSGTKSTTVTDARGYQTRHTYGTRWLVDEGLLLSVEHGVNSGTQRTVSYRYRSPSAGPYPNPIGVTPAGNVRGDNDMAARHNPQDKRTTSQQGGNFVWEGTAYDSQARPTTVWRSGPSGSRAESTTYHDNLGLWVLGQVDQVTSGGLTVVDNDYHAGTAMLYQTRKFGVLQATYQYHGDGTLASRADGAGNVTSFSSYKRGLPQSVGYPTGASQVAVVNDLGLVTSVTGARFSSEPTYTTSYGYDAIGRLSSITPPGGFASTSITFAPATSTAYGLPAGHWVHTVTKGNAVTKTYLDALWRPVMSRTYDATSGATEAATRKVVVNQFDADGRTTYESYPARDITAYNATPGGVQISYDALGRETLRTATSELGNLTTTTAYLSGFLTQVTNPRSKVTTQSFWALEDPAAAQLASITAPEGVSVSISRDSFGKPTAITRGGTSINTNAGYTSSVTRNYVYDVGQRLCKTIEPEVGATVQVYDAAGNIQWKAPGQNLPATNACNDTSVGAAAKITYGYDPLNQLRSTTYGDSSPDVVRTYTGDGLLKTITSNGSSWTYDYNALRKPSSESLAYAGQTYGMSWAYNTQGDLNLLTYPASVALGYGVNALGEIESIGGYASGITYHPNGAVAGYTLNNGIAHTITQHIRGLPWVSTVGTVLQDAYTYDANGNVAAITDQRVSPSDGSTSRTMTYDDLDRLAAASAPGIWGSATYKYDTVDNLRSAVVGTRASTMNFVNNQLANVVTNSATTNYTFSPLANLATKGTQNFSFDLGNRLTTSPGGTYAYDGLGRRIKIVSSDASTRIQVYSQAGQLLWSTNVGGGRPTSETAYIHLAGKQIAETQKVGSTLTTQFAHTDVLGSPVAHTGPTGALINRSRFEPYGYVAAGTQPGPNTSIVGFTGHVQDPETDLVYMQQRYYDRRSQV
jgi:uncharacterized protein RhaS with RHS repeats